MNTFIIHSTSDAIAVNQHLSAMKKQAYSLNPLLLKNDRRFWKRNCKKKIKNSQLVLFFVGEKSHASPYIGWEIKETIRQKKPLYIIKLNPAFKDHDALVQKEGFSDERFQYGTPAACDDVARIITDYEIGDYHLVNTQYDGDKEKTAFEQYKLFLQTSESLVSRRQSVSTFYISINTAIFSLFGVVALFGIDEKLVVFLFCFGCVLGYLLNITWIKLLDSYGSLNASKMHIISKIEQQLPFHLFDAEWEVLSSKLNHKKYTSFTASEKRVPKLFICLYSLFLLFLVLYYFLALV